MLTTFYFWEEIRLSNYSPDYVLSIYPKKAEKKAANLTAVDSLACFERAQ